MKSFQDVKKNLLKNGDVQRQYDALGPEFAIIDLMVQRRIQRGLSQQDLAEKMGTQQSAISRFESGTHNPTLDFLYKIASALDTKITFTLS